jgi:DNA-binding NtrC family response regulator
VLPLTSETDKTLLVVDDDRVISTLLKRWLELDGWAVETVRDGETCLAQIAHKRPAAICLDLNLPGLGGVETLQRILDVHHSLPIVMLTADGSAEKAVEALKNGAYDYLTKPPNRAKLLQTIRNAVEHGQMALRLRDIEHEIDAITHRGIIGDSPQIKSIFREMDAVALSDVTVLIHGESGTGKELIAAGLHAASPRSKGPLVTLNCAAIPESLQESELFGHERGAFTGASSSRQGRFELANGGTLFLDEVGDLSAAAQAKLLRVLEVRTFQRVGGVRDLKSDFRLISATHRNLRDDVRSGRFREDLYYRLAVFEIEVPPLRQRGADVVLLAAEFAARHGQRLRGKPATLDEKSIDLIRAYQWPGNVRELDNAIQKAVVSCHGGIVHPADFPERLRQPFTSSPQPSAPQYSESRDALIPQLTLTGSLEDIEKRAIEYALLQTGHNRAATSRILGIGRTTLYAKMKKYGLESTEIA